MKKRFYLLRTGAAMLLLPLISSCATSPILVVEDSVKTKSAQSVPVADTNREFGY